MYLPFSWITKTISIIQKLIVIDNSLKPKVALVGDTDKQTDKKMKVIKLTFKQNDSTILIREITSKEKLFVACTNVKSDVSPNFLFLGIETVGDSSSPFICKDRVILSGNDDEIFFSVFDTGKPLEITIKYTFLKRHSFFI